MSRRLLRLALAALVAAALLGPAGAAERSPVVVELFTSQGCSSCPPADEFLAELAERPGVLALSFHVDYWNYIGWTDPFASKASTKRQKGYSRSLGQRYVYTPEMVVEGAAHEAGSERDAVERLIAAAKAQARPQPGLVLDRSGEVPLVRVSALAQGAPGEGATLWLVEFDREHTTPVERGENGGRTLRNAHVVRELRALGTWSGEAASFALAPETLAGERGIAVILQTERTGPVIAAALLKPAP